MDYRYGSHTVFKIEYHFVWVTKYRYKLLVGDVGQRVRELVRQTMAFKVRGASHVWRAIGPRRHGVAGDYGHAWGWASWDRGYAGDTCAGLPAPPA